MALFRTIFQPSKTDVPVFTAGSYQVPSQYGGILKSSEAGTVSVRYLSDPEGTYRKLRVSNDEQWLPDVIAEIREHADTTVDVANLLIGMN